MIPFKLIAAAMLAIIAVPGAARQAPAPAAPIPSATVSPQLTQSDVDTWLDGYMPYALKRGDIAGAVVVVVKDGRVLTQRGFGYSDVAKRTPVNPATTMFRPGSISKLFTWTAVMQLVEQGKLDLDKDVNTYLDFKIPPRQGQPITLRNIMTHTAGFEEVGNGVIVGNPKNIRPLDEALKRWMPRRIFAPGVSPAYSNYATGLAGYIVQRVSGMPFDDYLDRHVFGPLQMTRSSFRQPLPAHLLPFVSKGYAQASGEAKPYEFVNPSPAGALAATGADMAKFMIAHLNQGGALLRPETARMMHDTKLTILPPLNRMALGFYEQNINGRSVIAHAGDTWWFHSELWLFPNENVGVFVSLNSVGKDYAVSGARGLLLEQFADRYFPSKPHDRRVDAKTAAEHARMMVGTYISTRRSESNFAKMLELTGQLKIGLNQDGGISLGSGNAKWVEIAPFVWRDLDSHERVAAKLVDGKVVRVGFDGGSPIVMYDRAPWYRSTAWILPLLLAGLAALALTAIAWPVTAIVRRRHGAKLEIAGRDLRAYRLVRGFASAAVAVIVGWITSWTIMGGDMDNLAGGYEPYVWLLQIVGVVAFPVLMGAALWNGWQVWARKSGWFSKLWSVVLIVAALSLLWTALVFNLISFGANF